MLSFGMPTLIEASEPEACAALCADLGLDFIELNMNLPACQTHRMDTDLLLRLGEQYGIYYTIHLDENLNPCDFNSRVAAAYTDTVMDTIAIARKLGAPVLNMHLSRGVYFTLPDRRVYLFEQYREEYLRSFSAFRDCCADAAKDSGVTLCVENSDGYTDYQKEALDLLMEHPAFALTYDVGHDHAVGGIDRQVILERSERLAHMHLHDAAGKSNHLTLGTGELDIPSLLALAAEHNCRVVLETKTIDGLKASVNWLRKHGFICS